MSLELYLRGLAIGLAVAFALGPIGLLVIRRTIERGWVVGLASGLGVATADGAYAAVAAFGLTALTRVLVGVDRPLGVVGGLALLILGWRALRAADAIPVATRVRGPGGLAQAWITMVALTLANPATILSFAALFASIGAGTGGPAGATAVVAGVATGSVAWWCILTALVAGLRTRLSPRVVRGLNVASAVLIGGFGAVAIGLGLAG